LLLCVPNLLAKTQVAAIRAKLDDAAWVDGRTTAGAQSGAVKRNTQLPEDHPLTRQLGDIVLDAIAENALFLSAALPLKIFPPLFNRYLLGDGFGAHIDNAIRPVKNQPVRVRTDLSVTVFLAEPHEYEGGELVIETKLGAQEVKLEAGAGVLYPSGSLHHVNEIVRGARLASFFWVQSMVRDEGQRELLFDLDQSIQALVRAYGHENAEVVRLTGIYHNLIRRWSDT
jgi:PKHD-type hydroxylase